MIIYRGNDESGATFSVCEQFRYRLWRRWLPMSVAPALVMLMLNPSTADELKNDPTVGRCEARARRLGFGSLEVLNIFAFRATDPDDMKAATDPVGPLNDGAIYLQMFADRLANDQGWPRPVFCAGWGVHGAHQGRDRQVAEMARTNGVQLQCLGTTKGGQPRHPLYIANDRAFEPWEPRAAA